MRLILLLFFVFASCQQQEKEQKPLILVSIAPFAGFIKTIAEDTVDLIVIVPPGVDSHTFEPSPKETMKMKRALVWFQMGDPFEKKLGKALLKQAPQLKKVDLNEGLPLISMDHHGHSHGFDVHLWLDPLLAAKQCDIIIQTLSETVPEKALLYAQNGEKLKKALLDLDEEIAHMMRPLKTRAFLTSHPSFAYFCKRYALTQLSLETEGKDPLPKDVEEIVKKAKEEKVAIMLLEPQFSSKGALTVAKKLGIPARMVDPYAEDYFKSLRHLSCLIAQPHASCKEP